MPVATKDFRFEAAGDIVFYTLQHAFIMDMYSYSFYFQVVMILALIAVVVWKGKFSRVFTAITGCFYLLYAVLQCVVVKIMSEYKKAWKNYVQASMKDNSDLELLNELKFNNLGRGVLITE